VTIKAHQRLLPAASLTPVLLSDDRSQQIGMIIGEGLSRLHNLRYIGYDPADLMNSSWKGLTHFPERLLRFLTILNFYSPVNIRPLLRIRPSQNTTAMVILGRTCLNGYRQTARTEWLDYAQELADWLLQHAIRRDNTLGWSRIIPYQAKSDFMHASGCTLTFINAHAAEFFLDFHEISGDPQWLDCAGSVCQHLLRHTNRLEFPFGICLSYINDAQEEVPNASILAGCVLHRYGRLKKDEEITRLSMSILDYTLHRQNADGSWDFCFDPGKPARRQYDFHQCYMLDGIRKYGYDVGSARQDRIRIAFEKGMTFYLERLFDADMRPFWRYPHKYPIDVHNVSHAVYFLARYNRDVPDAAIRLEKLLGILLDKMYDKRRQYFYYQVYPLYRVKHDFLRWNTAWSLYALSHLPFAGSGTSGITT